MFESRFYLYLLRFANLVLPCWWGFGVASKILATLPCSCTSCPLQQTSSNGGSLSSVCCEKLRVCFKQLIRGNTTPFQLLLNAKHTKRRVYVASLRLKLDFRIIWKFTKKALMFLAPNELQKPAKTEEDPRSLLSLVQRSLFIARRYLGPLDMKKIFYIYKNRVFLLI